VSRDYVEKTGGKKDPRTWCEFKKKGTVKACDPKVHKEDDQIADNPYAGYETRYGTKKTVRCCSHEKIFMKVKIRRSVKPRN
jgi:hypothetical protein